MKLVEFIKSLSERHKWF